MRHRERNVKALRMRQEGVTFAAIGNVLGLSVEGARRAVWCADMMKQEEALGMPPENLRIHIVAFLRQGRPYSEAKSIVDSCDTAAKWDEVRSVVRDGFADGSIHPGAWGNFGVGKCGALRKWAKAPAPTGKE